VTLLEIRKLTLSKVDKLLASAKKGDAVALRDFVHYSLWRKIDAAKMAADAAKEELFHALIKKVKIKLVKGKKRG